MTNIKKPSLVVMASGEGTLFAHIVEASKTGHLKAQVIALFSDNLKALVLKKARDKGIETKVLNSKSFAQFEDWDKALLEYLKTKNPDFILLAGFLKKIGPRVLTAFKGRMLNIHPSLLPRHGGKGMYGIHVHRSVLKAGDKTTGVSIHWVSKDFDKGPLLAQKKVAVHPQDSPEALQKRVKQVEKEFYVSTLQKLLSEYKTPENP